MHHRGGGAAGAANAALLAVAMLATTDEALRAKLEARRVAARDRVLAEVVDDDAGMLGGVNA